MKLEVGMYVRTINNKAVGNGVIGRIKYINERDFNGKQKKYYSVWTNNKNWFEIGSISEVKSSNNLIDLIEVGDYVNGAKVWEVKKEIKGFGVIVFDDNTSIHEYNIKSIVTKEQFKANAYTIEK